MSAFHIDKNVSDVSHVSDVSFWQPALVIRTTYKPGSSELIYETITQKNKGAHEPKAQTAETYPCFLSTACLGVLLLPPGRDASPSQGYPPVV